MEGGLKPSVWLVDLCPERITSVLAFLPVLHLWFRDARNSGYLYVFGGEAVSVIPGTGFIPNSLNTIDGMLRAAWMISDLGLTGISV